MSLIINLVVIVIIRINTDFVGNASFRVRNLIKDFVFNVILCIVIVSKAMNKMIVTNGVAYYKRVASREMVYKNLSIYKVAKGGVKISFNNKEDTVKIL